MTVHELGIEARCQLSILTPHGPNFGHYVCLLCKYQFVMSVDIA